MWDNYQFQYSNLLYDKDIFLNVGIGYALREYVYSTNPRSPILKFFKTSIYSILDLFVSSVPKYKFSDQIKNLNNFLST
jgi:hypothetical protein